MTRKMWRIPVGPSESGAASDPIRFLLPTDLIDLIQKSIRALLMKGGKRIGSFHSNSLLSPSRVRASLSPKEG